MRTMTAGLFHSVDALVEAPSRALGIAAAIATVLRAGRDTTGRLLDPANLPDRMKHDIGLPSGRFGTSERHWSDYR